MITTKLTGDWNRLANKLRSLPSDISQAKELGLQKAGNETVKTVKGHIERQDLGWSPLDESTIKQKGHSKILVETGTLASHIDVTEVSKDSIFIGAKNATYPNGEDVNDVLKYHEFGTETEPPRPLVRPSFNEVKPKVKDMIKEEIINAIKK